MPSQGGWESFVRWPVALACVGLGESLSSGERSGQEGGESLLRGKLKWKSRRRGSAPEDGTKASERSFSGANWL